MLLCSMAFSQPSSNRPRPGIFSWIAASLAVIIVGMLIYHRFTHATAEPAASVPPPLWGLGTIPFGGLLAAIALLPLIPFTHHWWESNRNRLIVSLCCAALTLLYYLLVKGTGAVVHVLEHAVVDEYI